MTGAQRGPVLIEEEAVLQPCGRARLAQRIVEALDRQRIAFQFADHGPGVQVVHSRHAHPFADHPEIDAVVFLARVSRIARAVQVQNHIVLPRPLGHRLNGGVANHEIDHDDRRTQFFGALGALVHLFHRAGGYVEIVALHLAGGGGCPVHRFHAAQEALPPAHERLRIDVLVVLGEIQAAAQSLINHPAVVASRKTQLGFHGGAEQRAAELIQPFALHHYPRRGPLKGLEISNRNAHVFQAQRANRFEAEYVADDRSRQVGDGAPPRTDRDRRRYTRTIAPERSAPGRRGKLWRGRRRRRSTGPSRPPSTWPSKTRRQLPPPLLWGPRRLAA